MLNFLAEKLASLKNARGANTQSGNSGPKWGINSRFALGRPSLRNSVVIVSLAVMSWLCSDAVSSQSLFPPLTRGELAAKRFPFNLDDAAQLAPRFVGDVDGNGKQYLVALDPAGIKRAHPSDLGPQPLPNKDALSGQVFSSRDFEADWATLPTATNHLGVIPQIGLDAEKGPKPPCSLEKSAALLAQLRAPTRSKASFEVRIDCSFTLAPGEIIKKRLIFEGTDASGVTVEGNGATIDGTSIPFADDPDEPAFILLIQSTDAPVFGDLQWARPRNITLRNLKIKGSVGIVGMQGVETDVENYVALARNNAPRDILFDDVTITQQMCKKNPGSGACVPLYLFGGVNYFQMRNSEINGFSTGPNIYLDDTSYRNTFRSNYIHAITVGTDTTGPRELMSIDGSSENLIINNRFYALQHGGIYLYKNCGEGGSMRRGFPSNNTIINNVFYYDWLYGNPPSIYVASRNGRSSYCSPNFFDEARFNVVMQNQIQPERPSINDSSLLGDMIKVGHPEINTPNYIAYNETVDAKIERGAGCYISNGYPDFLRDGESTNVFHNANGDPFCTGYRLTCDDGVLRKTSDSMCQVSQVGYVDFECQVSDKNSGCQKTVSLPQGKKIIGSKVACNLEFGSVTLTDLNGVIPNFIKVLRASDNVTQGSCTVGSTSIRSGQEVVSGINGLNSISFGCRENDSNGGDCHIKGGLYYK